LNLRETKGQTLAANNHVTRVDEDTYRVRSQSSNRDYDIIATELGFKCSCPDHMFRGAKCKHIFCVEFSLKLREKVEEDQVIIPAINYQNCPRCKLDNIVKHGIRHNKSGNLQRYFCNDCSKWFGFNLGFEGMHASPQVITSAMQLYFTGESLRNVRRFLELQGVKISHMSVYRWIGKYVTLMNNYLEQIKPNVSNVWRTDELYLKVKGNNSIYSPSWMTKHDS